MSSEKGNHQTLDKNQTRAGQYTHARAHTHLGIVGLLDGGKASLGMVAGIDAVLPVHRLNFGHRFDQRLVDRLRLRVDLFN